MGSTTSTTSDTELFKAARHARPDAKHFAITSVTEYAKPTDWGLVISYDPKPHQRAWQQIARAASRSELLLQLRTIPVERAAFRVRG